MWSLNYPLLFIFFSPELARATAVGVPMEWVYNDKFNNVGTALSAVRAEVWAEKHLRALRARKERREQRLGAAEDRLLRSSSRYERYKALQK